VVDLYFITAVLQRALKTMTDLEEMVVVRDTTIEGPCTIFQPLGQIKFYGEQRVGEAEERWPTESRNFLISTSIAIGNRPTFRR
jgi:hypothetical protein